MPNRQPLTTNEYYHIYNRGVDKRNIFKDKYDLNRFFQGIEFFNRTEPIVSLQFLQRVNDRGLTPTKKVPKEEKLVEIIAYCVNPNHYHFILKQLVDGGISEFMKRLGGGYTCYFNERYERTGVLFQGTFKSKHIATTPSLLYLSAYVNLNAYVHKIEKVTSPVKSVSSFDEYMKNGKEQVCEKEIILNQFDSPREYREFSNNVVSDILNRRYPEEDFEKILIE